MSKTIHCDWSDCKTTADVSDLMGPMLPIGWALIQWHAEVPGNPDKVLDSLKKMYKGMLKALPDPPPPEVKQMFEGVTSHEPPPSRIMLEANICPTCLGEFIRLDKFVKHGMF